MTTKLILKNVTLGFPDIVEPKEFKGKKRWGANFIIEADSTACIYSKDAKKEYKPALSFVQSVLKDIAAAEFGGKLPPGKDCAFRDGNDNVSASTGEIHGGFEGRFYIASYRQEKKPSGEPNSPPLVTNARLQAVRPGDPCFPQSGDRVTVILDLYTQGGKSDKKKDYGRKLNSGFETIQYLRAGDVSYGAPPPTAAGLDVEEDEDPTAEL